MFRRILFGLVVFLLLSASTLTHHSTRALHRHKCVGYSIIEFGKAIDCNGDTIHLRRKDGLQVFIAANHQ